VQFTFLGTQPRKGKYRGTAQCDLARQDNALFCRKTQHNQIGHYRKKSDLTRAMTPTKHTDWSITLSWSGAFAAAESLTSTRSALLIICRGEVAITFFVHVTKNKRGLGIISHFIDKDNRCIFREVLSAMVLLSHRVELTHIAFLN
jgi:hypothetical protein